MKQVEYFYRHSWTNRFLKRPLKRYLLRGTVDIATVVVASYVAFTIFFSQQPTTPYQQYSVWVLFSAIVYVACNYIWHNYERLWRYATARDVMALAEAVSIATLILVAWNLLFGNPDFTKPLLLAGAFTFLLMFAIRCRRLLFIRGYSILQKTKPKNKSSQRKRTLIIGAGDNGHRLARHLHDDLQQRQFYKVVGFVDDDQTKVGLRIHGLGILGVRNDIPNIVKNHSIDQIIIASPSSFGESINTLISICQQTTAQIKILPRFFDLLDNNNHFPNLRDLTIEDLLGRDSANIDHKSCQHILQNRVVLVTGAGGSIGSELCRQLVQFFPAQLLLVDNNETALHDLHLELTRRLAPQQDTELHPLVADITNELRMNRLFQQYKPEIVFHAAAFKHVPMMEKHPDEAVRVNILGSMILTQLAMDYDVGRFIFISTDKAVNPTSVMGASKRIVELWLTAVQPTSKTKFTAVRFGNVVGSRGSVVPLFKQQIDRGGPITITDPRMTRYFMSIPEAAILIIQAGAFAKGGEIYMLDMGQPISIIDLAQKMIRLKGLRPGTDIPMKFVGIRPGEKLHEELAYDIESKRNTTHTKIYGLNHQSTNDLSIIKTQLEWLINISVYAHGLDNQLLRDAILFFAQGKDGRLQTIIEKHPVPNSQNKLKTPEWVQAMPVLPLQNYQTNRKQTSIKG